MEQTLIWISGFLCMVVIPWDLLGFGQASPLLALRGQTNLYECRRTSTAPQASSQEFTFHSHPHKGQNSFPATSWESALDYPTVADMELGPWALLRGADTRLRLKQNCTPRSQNKWISVCCVLVPHGPSQLVQPGYTVVEGEVLTLQWQKQALLEKQQLFEEASCALGLCRCSNTWKGNTRHVFVLSPL